MKVVSVCPTVSPEFINFFGFALHDRYICPTRLLQLNLLRPTVGPTKTEISTTVQLSDLQINCLNSTKVDTGQQAV